MTKFTAVILASGAVAVLGIVADSPYVVVAGTLSACGTLLFAALSYLETVR